MILFFYKPKQFSPLLFIIAKLESKDEYEKLEALTNEVFQILIDQKEATEQNILIFSIIKDYEKLTINLILPSTKSNQKITDNCHSNLKLMNNMIYNMLVNLDTEFYLELTNSKILIHPIKLNLMALSKYYLIT
jgi:hypothetical protein